jgi:hypothetical protein
MEMKKVIHYAKRLRTAAVILHREKKLSDYFEILKKRTIFD